MVGPYNSEAVTRSSNIRPEYKKAFFGAKTPWLGLNIGQEEKSATN